MFGATKIWSRSHRRVNINQRRYAVVSALAASAVPSLDLARGHRIESVPEISLVLSDSVESITSSAIKILKQVGELMRIRRKPRIRLGSVLGRGRCATGVKSLGRAI
ncbi:60S ribosomal protein L4-1 [Dendrobium catenatum]|uniref:60S ribosomal protein L4-1 n=1 Tax=Dendrobium catenatum TaxID=906689 RepID=A0A2I0X285_9ASPA|nr:60S ribosomal protein L4-1 [Dendrobium catenatum]